MVHVRLNERETNPNPHINFITPLQAGDLAAQDDARQLLRALAAQVRPLMKAHGFAVNSLEEYEYNRVFSGRNWNSGETVELVLRSQNGSFVPTPYLMSTLCHEHMHHGPAFQSLWAQLRRELRELQAKGYYGDGYWSSGTRLADSARMHGQGIAPGDLPEYLCGGAHSRARPPSFRRQKRKQAGPSLHTGAQTAKRRKAGARVTAQGAFGSGGRALDEDVEDGDAKKAGAGFRKKAGSKRAREERAMAAERRLLALQQASGPSNATSVNGEDESDSDDGRPTETDQDRRRTMLDSMSESEAGTLKAFATDFADDFILPSAGASGSQTSVGGGPPSTASSTGVSPSTDSLANRGKGKGTLIRSPPDEKQYQKSIADYLDPSRLSKKRKFSYGNLVEDEIDHRQKEALGMTGGGKKLGAASTSSGVARGNRGQSGVSSFPEESAPPQLLDTQSASWSCQVCTLVNEPEHLACSVCATPREESSWSGNSV
ncbi:hypothetical protein PHLGIDRAFT_23623 [Phlebiopsis gigantea 11061_1 CR5-6]|uniref:WLM domain-containing protein n=1 Tax=Phlebiopsis gigantea (strain 11061_1 CR5-6) TaxID=745531 RepID=A0A0C3S060_PHLG1|nr:hypothetical protein PHLGIDRAFT_23623 [Phlebiopsis gigantea 11061_1 CR5-6]